MNFKLYSTKRKIFRVGLLISGILAVFIALITFYGQNTGNFVMTVDDEGAKRGIALSKEPNFIYKTSRLITNAVTGAGDMTFDWVDWEGLSAAEGDYVDPDPSHKYIGYTFYLINTGDDAINVQMQFDITTATNNLEKALAIAIIEDSGETVVYMQTNTEPWQGYDSDIPQELKRATAFESDTRAFTRTIRQLRPGQYKKFTVAVWLESYDPDHNDSLADGKLKMSMKFTVSGKAE